MNHPVPSPNHPNTPPAEENQELRRQIDALQRDLERVRSKKEWMERTFSWKVTTPLRLLRQWFRPLLRKSRAPKNRQAPRGRPRDPVRTLRFTIDLPPATQFQPPDRPLDRQHLDLHWIVPDFRPGAGGHMVIFKIMHLLEQEGHRHTLWIMNPNDHQSSEQTLATLHQHFFPIHPEIRLLNRDSVVDLVGDAVIATDRWTTYYARAALKVRAKFYFVQDFEPVFYPLGAEYLLTENTYHFGFQHIASSPWLKEKIQALGPYPVTTIDYAYDRQHYFLPKEKTPRQKNTILFYSRGATPRRAVEIGFLAFSLLYRQRQDFQLLFFGDQPKPYDLDFPFEDRGILSHRELGELYREATLGVVFSATNISLIPKEMMACGLPVIDLNRPNTRLSLPPGTATLVDPDPRRIAQNLSHLLDHPEERRQQAEKALAYVQQLTWEKAAAVFSQTRQKTIPTPSLTSDL